MDLDCDSLLAAAGGILDLSHDRTPAWHGVVHCRASAAFHYTQTHTLILQSADRSPLCVCNKEEREV